MKHKWLWLLITICLAAASIRAVLEESKDLSLQQLMSNFADAIPGWIVLAVLCMFGYIFFEYKSISCVLDALGYGRSMKNGLVYSSADIYFSSITPSATGGQPAAVFMMMKDGIPGSVATAALILTLMMYTLSILVIGITCLIFNPILFNLNHLSIVLILCGGVILFFFSIIILLLIRRSVILGKIAQKLIYILGRIHIIKNPAQKLERVEKSIDQYEKAISAARSHKYVLLRCFIYNMLQRASQITVSAMMFMAMGGRAAEVFDIWSGQALVTIGYTCVPIPGAMGAADYMMLDAFSNVVSKSFAVQLEVASRSLAFYCCVLISGIIIAMSIIINGGKRKRGEHK